MLTFEPMVFDKKTVNFYIKSFQNKELRKILYATTPYTKPEIVGWLHEVLNNPDVTPFTIRMDCKIIGQVDLDDPNRLARSVRLGCFLAKPKLWPELGPEIFKYIIMVAKEREWKYLYCDVAGAEKGQVAALKSLGFRPTLSKPSLLINNL